ncbi:MAG: siroheme decarboxylase subunit alpha [Promethearchaeota archaeon]|jgi:DNA-binding Lrp family transcriptional regulator
MIEGLDKTDKKLINLMQNYFPLSSHPYEDIAKKLGLTTDNIITRLEKLSNKGLIRKVGAIISAKNIGFKSILAAVSVPEEQIEEASNYINSYSGVTHNYLREGNPNIWFTLTEKDEEILEAHLEEIENKLQSKIIRLPAEKTYKIGVKFDIR